MTTYAKQRSTRNLTTETVIKKFKEVHGTKYDYSLVEYVNAHTKIKIICPIHGVFLQSANSHKYGSGCHKCGGRGSMDSEYIINRYRQVHQDKYDYSKVDYSRMDSQIEIICPRHGSFYQRASDHMSGRGCPKCSNWLESREVINRFVEVHGDDYDYSNVVFTGMKNKVEIICPTHGSFWQAAYSHQNGHGCPDCAKINFVSKQEKKWISSLNIPTLIQQHKIESTIHNRTFVVDGYDPETNTVFLYHGDWWHGNLNRYDRSKFNSIAGKTMGELNDQTILYEQQIQELGYNIVVKWESE